MVAAAFAASPPPDALTCPRCAAPATPGPEAQACTRCGGAFALYAGAALDGAVRPPPIDPGAERVKVRSAAVVTYRIGMLDPQGVSEGMADPITGLVPIDQSGVAYQDVVTIGIWRKPDLVELFTALLIPTPIATLLLLGAVKTPQLLVIALPFALVAAWMIHRAIVVQATFARVVGRYRAIKVRFDRPGRRRRRFHDELLRRSGVVATPAAGGSGPAIP